MLLSQDLEVSKKARKWELTQPYYILVQKNISPLRNLTNIFFIGSIDSGILERKMTFVNFLVQEKIDI